MWLFAVALLAFDHVVLSKDTAPSPGPSAAPSDPLPDVAACFWERVQYETFLWADRYALCDSTLLFDHRLATDEWVSGICDVTDEASAATCLQTRCSAGEVVPFGERHCPKTPTASPTPKGESDSARKTAASALLAAAAAAAMSMTFA